MSNSVKFSFIVFIMVLVIIQFFDPAPINPIVHPNNNILTYRPANDEVTQLFKNTCFDCHSFETNYPWYAYVAPASWVVAKHVEQGRQHVNFSEWTKYSPEEHTDILRESADEIEQNEMPLKSYRYFHPEAQLHQIQKQQLIDYFRN
jgi:hypothetical protein